MMLIWSAQKGWFDFTNICIVIIVLVLLKKAHECFVNVEHTATETSVAKEKFIFLNKCFISIQLKLSKVLIVVKTTLFVTRFCF